MQGFTMERRDRDCLVAMEVDLTAALVPSLQAALKAEIKAGAARVVVDLSRAAMLDSSGIGLLIALSNSLRRAGGTLEVVNPSRDVGGLLQSMRLLSRLNVRDAGQPA